MELINVPMVNVHKLKDHLFKLICVIYFLFFSNPFIAVNYVFLIHSFVFNLSSDNSIISMTLEDSVEIDGIHQMRHEFHANGSSFNRI